MILRGIKRGEGKKFPFGPGGREICSLQKKTRGGGKKQRRTVKEENLPLFPQREGKKRKIRAYNARRRKKTPEDERPFLIRGGKKGGKGPRPLPSGKGKKKGKDLPTTFIVPPGGRTIEGGGKKEVGGLLLSPGGREKS